ncbi:MAG TPA: DUF6226 family protein [Gemmatimonadaceae bacterium]|nr:DUF6226 family protein [Gemmatimonadaceae bacterium]
MSDEHEDIEGPPPEAYSRITNPDRFAPLHDDALNLLSRLSAEFDVQRSEGYGLDPELERADLARQTVQLVPANPASASLTFVFTTFPSVNLRCGRLMVETFPCCGCDACGETAASEGKRLHAVIDEVVHGHFREEITIPWLGRASQKFELGTLGSPNGLRKGGVSLERLRARALVRGGTRSWQWAPWPTRHLR